MSLLKRSLLIFIVLEFLDFPNFLLTRSSADPNFVGISVKNTPIPRYLTVPNRFNGVTETTADSTFFSFRLPKFLISLKQSEDTIHLVFGDIMVEVIH